MALSPVVTIVLSLALLGERTGRLGVAGIILAVVSLPLFDYAPGPGVHHYGTWFSSRLRSWSRGACRRIS